MVQTCGTLAWALVADIEVEEVAHRTRTAVFGARTVLAVFRTLAASTIGLEIGSLRTTLADRRVGAHIAPRDAFQALFPIQKVSIVAERADVGPCDAAAVAVLSGAGEAGGAREVVAGRAAVARSAINAVWTRKRTWVAKPVVGRFEESCQTRCTVAWRLVAFTALAATGVADSVEQVKSIRTIKAFVQARTGIAAESAGLACASRRVHECCDRALQTS